MNDKRTLLVVVLAIVLVAILSFFLRGEKTKLTISDVEFNIKYDRKIKKNQIEYIRLTVKNLNNFSVKVKVNIETQPVNSVHFLLSDTRPRTSKVIHWHHLNLLHPHSRVEAEIPFIFDGNYNLQTISIFLRLTVTRNRITEESVVNFDMEIS